MSVPVSTIVNIVRDLIPDPVYDSTGTAQPQTDGSLFRAQSLIRFINDGMKALAEQIGWVVNDWTAVAVTANQPWYVLNGQWHQLDEGFQNSYRLQMATEGLTIWPKAVVGGQSIWYDQHKRTDHMEVGLFPVPNTSDPSTTLSLSTTMSAVATSMTMASGTGMLAFGYLQIGSEIVSYQTLSGLPTVGVGAVAAVLSRGQCSTTAATHTHGETVTHLSAWFKGSRMPNEVTTTTDTVEIPAGFIYAIQEYVLAKCDYGQNDLQGGKLHMEEFRKEAKRLQQDPGWRSSAQGFQVQPYGSPVLGRMIWGNVILP